MKKLALAILFTALATAGVVHKSSVSSATGKGFGTSYEQAVNKAIIDALGKLNGGYIASSEFSKVNDANDNGTSDYHSMFEQKIKKATKGSYSSYEVISESPSGDGYEVEVRVLKKSSYKYYKTPGQQTNKNNLVIVPSFSDVDFAKFGKKDIYAMHAMHTALKDEIYKARKFRLLDRDFQDATDIEESFIRSSGNKDEALKLGLSLGADYVMIYHVKHIGLDKGEVSQFTQHKANDKFSINVHFEVIALATKEVKYSKTIDFSRSIKNADGDDPYYAFMAAVAHAISNALHSGIYPPLVEDFVNSEAVFTQKLDIGEELECYSRGKVLKDSRTKEKSYLETYVGNVKVTRNNEKQSYAEVVSGRVRKGDICRPKEQSDSASAEQATGSFVPSEYGGGF